MRVLDLPGSAFLGKFRRAGQVSRAHCGGQGDSDGRAFFDRIARAFPPRRGHGRGRLQRSWVLALLVRAGVPACALDLSEDKRRPRLLIDEADLEKIRWRTGDVSESR